MNKKKILILGGGNSGRRFCKVLVFYEEFTIVLSSNSVNGKTKMLAEEYGLTFKIINDIFKENLVNTFDLIILSLPPYCKLEMLKSILSYGYNGKIIFEKPLSMDYGRAKEILSLIKCHRLKTLVAFNRRFQGQVNSDMVIRNDTIKIDFPHNISYKIDPIVHTLPHAIDTLLLVGGDGEIKLNKCIKLNAAYLVYGILNEKNFIINLYLTNNNKYKVKINDIQIEWPNVKCSLNMVKKVFDISYNESIYYLENAVNVTKALEEANSLINKGSF